MKISVDGGALFPKNNQGFGTTIFSSNLIKALSLYDKKNEYFIYTFENLKPKLFWMKGRVSFEEFRQKKDVFLALNQAIPLYTSGKTISFCHGLSYYFYPQYYLQKDYFRLKKQLVGMMERSDIIIVSSEKVKNELVSLGWLTQARIVVLPFGTPFDMNKNKFKIQNSKFKIKDKYFLFVANNQKIKNINFILQSFNRLKQDVKYKNYKLFLVGDWKEYENKNKGIISTGNVSRKKLKKLYQSATALLTSSYYESFNFPVLEALSQGCPVVGLKSAVIPEMRKFVEVADNRADFIDKIEKILTNKKKIDYHSLRTSFSWKKYVENLKKLYISG